MLCVQAAFGVFDGSEDKWLLAQELVALVGQVVPCGVAWLNGVTRDFLLQLLDRQGQGRLGNDAVCAAAEIEPVSATAMKCRIDAGSSC